MRGLHETVTYRVLSIGVNRNLRFAQKDASDFARAMGSAAGLIYPDDVTCLYEATVDELRVALAELTLVRPTYLCFFFSGHGTQDGIVLADGEMTFTELAAWMRRIAPVAAITVLDSCYSGGFTHVAGVRTGAYGLGAVDVDALELLARAVPGNRIICSVAADRLANEGGTVPNGHLTSALLAAMSSARGDLESRSGPMVSDARLFAAAKRIMKRRGDQVPVAKRLRGDFPVVRAQDEIIGAAALAHAGMVQGTFQATFCLKGRRDLPTVLLAEARNPRGEVIKAYRNVVVATDDVDQGTFFYPITAGDLVSDGLTALRLRGVGAAPIRWTLRVLDQRGRALTDAVRTATYVNSLSPYVRVGL